jgi:multicomponent Na+:H+ antiporter subunit B
LLVVLLLALMALAALGVVFSRDLLYAVISLGLLSVFTSVFFYTLGAPYASIMELSIGAGLITVLFMATISLVEERQLKGERKLKLSFLSVAGLLVTGAVALFIFTALFKGAAAEHAAVISPGPLPEILWGKRLLDVLGLGIIIFAAAIGIGALFRTEGEK